MCFLIAFGTVFLFVGVMIGVFGTRNDRQAAERATRLPIVTAHDVERGAIGAEVIIEGVIDQRNPTRVRNFVAYVREKDNGREDNGEIIWEEDERWTPPLIVRVADGVVQIANDTYKLRRPPVQSQGLYRYNGFEAGNSVMALGRIVDGPQGRAIEAEFIFGGSRNQYVANQRTEALKSAVFGIISGGMGMAAILYVVWSVLSGSRQGM